MLKERLQILISTDQRRRLEREAQRRGTSVASVIRDAVDAQLGGVTVEDRRAAVDRIGALRGRPLPPEELNRIVEEEREAEADKLLGHLRRA
jgi:hypothetical protein